MRKITVQLITAAILAFGGLVLLFCGVYIEPLGQIHDSLLIGFGEVATFAGALFGIDAAYSKKLWDYINSHDRNPTETLSGERSSPMTKTPSQANKSHLKHSTRSKTPSASSQPDATE